MTRAEYNAHRDMMAGCANGYRARTQAKPREGSPVMAFGVLLVMFSPLILWIAIEVQARF